MSAAKDLYAILGVSRTATVEEIRRVYRRLARKHHPDRNPGDKAAEERFKAIASAYGALSDPEKRKLYDEFGEDTLRSGFDAEKARAHQRWAQARGTGGGFGGGFGGEVPLDFDIADLFRGASGQRLRTARGEDVVALVELDFAQALRGAEIEVRVPVSTAGTAGESTHKIRIPPGADDGTELRVRGKGMPGRRGGTPGDLVIRTRVRPHSHFSREGLDLHLRLPVTLDEAYRGASIEVPTPEGEVQMKVPPRSSSGTKLRLRDKGVAREGKRGDLYVELQVQVPDREDAALVEALRDSGQLYSRPVREGIRL